MIKWVRYVGMAAGMLGMGLPAPAEPASGGIAFSVAMEKPNSHYFQVELHCDGLTGQVQDFKLPVWSPGYYMLMDYPKNVIKFRARDAQGQDLAWRKTAKNTWQVDTRGAGAVTVNYDVYAFAHSIAESSLDDGQAFLSPTSLFMHPAGGLGRPVTVTVRPAEGWNLVSTGLDPVPGRTNTFAAPDFDTLYDSPMLVGNQEVLAFDVKGVPHTFVGRDLGDFDRPRFVADLKRMVEGACALMGDIPYGHYTFLAIGPGGGGLEHLNSQAITFDGASLRDPEGYQRTMSFISHEFFHNFNVKRIRPMALGPFDYDRENYTNMLWVSEGLTVYYEDQVLVRNGFYSPEQYFERVRSSLLKFEEIPGHRHQTVRESSFDTWFGYFNHNEHQDNTTISYYDKGLALAVFLDFRIRHETGNRRSLDDVMRRLYRTIYKGQGRGFTDDEFRHACETEAGCALPEIFEVYADTTRDLDYARYFAYAGLEVDTTPRAQPGGFLGAHTAIRGGNLTVSRVELDSPASRAGLSIEDVLLEMDGRPCGSLAMRLQEHKPGDRVKLRVSRRGHPRELDVTLGEERVRSFAIKPMASPDPLQKAILAGWLTGK